MNEFKNCFYKCVCVVGYNHPKECKKCYNFVKLTERNTYLPWNTPYWKFGKKGKLISEL